MRFSLTAAALLLLPGMALAAAKTKPSPSAKPSPSPTAKPAPSPTAKPVPPGKDKDLAGDAIIEKMLEQDPLGFGGADAHVLMVLVDERGGERKRNADMLTRKDGKTRRSFIRFTAPADIAGTAFLGVDDAGERVQHLYLPALEKTRRIAGSQRNARWVGTDYSYADLDNRDIQDAVKLRLPDEKLGNDLAYVVETTPSDKSSEYAKVRVWVSKTTWLPVRIRFFDAAGVEVKRLTVQEVKKVSGKWIITESKMVDVKRDHTTVIKVVDITLRKDVPLDQFTVRALERG